MKKSSRRLKHIFIFAILLSLLGAICIGVGFAFGGDISYLGIGLNMDKFDFKNNGANSEKQTYEFIDSIDVNLDKGEVYIEEGTEFSIRIHGLSSDDYDLSYEDGELRFEELKSSWFRIGILTQQSNVTITIPKDTTLHKVDVKNDMGSIELKNIASKEFDIENNLGNIDLQDIKSKSLQVKNDLGEIMISGLLHNQSSITNRLGNVEVLVDDTCEDYSYDVDNGLGNTDVKNGFGSSNYHNDESNNYIELDNNLGNIDLIFMK